MFFVKFDYGIVPWAISSIDADYFAAKEHTGLKCLLGMRGSESQSLAGVCASINSFLSVVSTLDVLPSQN